MRASEELLERLATVRRDPIEFLKCVRTLDEVDKRTPIKPFPIHLPYIQLYCKLWTRERFIAVPKSRRMRMTWTNVALYTWDTIFNQGRHQAFVSKKEDDSNELVKRAKFIIDNIDSERLPRELLPEYRDKYCSLEFPQLNSKIVGFAQGADQLRQFTFSGILADEMAFWANAQKMYAGSFPTIEGGGRFTAISSAGAGFFRALVHDTLDTFGQDETEQLVEEEAPA